MNERIKELARQAGFIVDVSANADRQIQQLTEAIVRECGEVAFQQWCDNGEHESAQSAIFDHFGVK